MTDGRLHRVDPLAQPAQGVGGDGAGGSDMVALVHDLRERVRQLERRVASDPTQRPYERAVWGSADPTAAIATGKGDPYEVDLGGLLLKFVLVLKTAGTSTTTVELEVNGTPATFVETGLSTLSLTTGVTRAVGTVNGQVMAPGTLLVPDVTAAGSGAIGLSAFASIG